MSTSHVFRTNRTIAYSVLIVAIAVVFYALGSPAYIFAADFLLVAALWLGEYYRTKPNVNVSRSMYILLFASWLGLAIFFGLSALFVNTGILQPSLTNELVFIVISVAVGGEVGDQVGKRRGYKSSLG